MFVAPAVMIRTEFDNNLIQLGKQLVQKKLVSFSDPGLLVIYDKDSIAQRLDQAELGSVAQALTVIDTSVKHGIATLGQRPNGMNPVVSPLLNSPTEYAWTGNASQFAYGIAGIHRLIWTRHENDIPDIGEAWMITPKGAANVEFNPLLHLFNQ